MNIPYGAITVEKNGKSHTANWKLENGLVSLAYNFINKKAEPMLGSYELTANQLLTEILDSNYDNQ